MKQLKFIISLVGILLAQAGWAQEDRCDNDLTKRQTDSLKKVLSAEGYIVIREASVTMESEYDLPIIVPMTEGTTYHFVFIGDQSSDTYEVRMYDYREKQVVYLKSSLSETHSNIISYAYAARMSEYHLIKPMQANGNRKSNLCGHVILLRKAEQRKT